MAPAIAGAIAIANTIHGISRRGLRQPDRTVDHAGERPIGSATAKEIGDAGQEDEEIDGKAAIHRRRLLARGQRADYERHREREHAEVDRPERADQEDGVRR